MYKYDSLLFGNGLTLAIFSLIKNKTNSLYKKYLNVNNFIFDFVNSEDHKKIYRDFLKYFIIDKEIKKNHSTAKKTLKDNYNEISQIGFERWVSKHLFDSNFPKNIKEYIYILYNYWYHVIKNEIISCPKIINLLNGIGLNISKLINYKEKIYTTNFEDLLDTSLQPKHIHGKFRIPLDSLENLILAHFVHNPVSSNTQSGFSRTPCLIEHS